MSTSSRPSRKDYRRVRNETAEEEAAKASAENEVRVTAKGSQRMYITYAIATLLGQEDKTQYDTIKISGMGAAIYNVVNIAEIVKRRVPGIHQTTEISSQILQDEYEAIDKEKEDMTVERKVSTILITLSTQELDKSHIGYQAPLPAEEVTEQEERKPGVTIRERKPTEGRSGRGSRGSRGGKKGDDKKSDEKKGDEKKGEKADGKPSRGGRRGAPKAAAGDEKPAAKGGRRGPKADEDKPAARGGRRGGAPKGDDEKPRGGRGPRSDKPRSDKPRDEKPRDEKPRGGRGGRSAPKSDDKPARGGRGGAPKSDDKPARGGRGSGRGGRGSSRSERGGKN